MSLKYTLHWLSEPTSNLYIVRLYKWNFRWMVRPFEAFSKEDMNMTLYSIKLLQAITWFEGSRRKKFPQKVLVYRKNRLTAL